MSAATAVSNDLFDLDDLLNDVAPSKPTEKKEAPSPVPSPTPQSAITRHRATCPKDVLFFDLETIPDYSRESLFDLPAIPKPAEYIPENDCPAPSKLVEGTEEQIKATVAKAQAGGKMLPRIILESCLQFEAKKEKSRKGVMSLFADAIKAIDNESVTIQATIDANRKTMSVTPEMLRIASFGWACGDDVVNASTFGNDDATKCHDTYERCVLTKFWELAKRAKVIIGFNHVGFDLPAVYHRSAMLGVRPSRAIDLKPWGGEVVDLFLAMWPRAKPVGGNDASRRMKDFARFIGLSIPAGDFDGSQVEEFLKKDPAKVAEYNRSDVVLTREIYLTYRGFYWP